MKSPVYEEWAHRLVKSDHGLDVYYRVFKGIVNWSKSAGGMKPAIVVFIQYGKTEDWEKARGREVAFDLPAHILERDLPDVLAAIQELSYVGK